jgi:hypothetical protein
MQSSGCSDLSRPNSVHDMMTKAPNNVTVGGLPAAEQLRARLERLQRGGGLPPWRASSLRSMPRRSTPSVGRWN